MNSGLAQKEIKNVQKTSRILRTVVLIPCMLFVYLGVPTICIIITLVAFFLSDKLTAFSTPNVHMDKFFMSCIYSLSPIWIFLLDPCAVAYAHSVTMVNSLMIIVFQRNNYVRL